MDTRAAHDSHGIAFLYFFFFSFFCSCWIFFFPFPFLGPYCAAAAKWQGLALQSWLEGRGGASSLPSFIFFFFASRFLFFFRLPEFYLLPPRAGQSNAHRHRGSIMRLTCATRRFLISPFLFFTYQSLL